MKKTLIEKIPIELPDEIGRICCGARVFDSSSSAEAKVYFIDKDGGYYLKCAKGKSLRREAEMTDYFHKKGLGAELLCYLPGERNLMLSRALPGEDCTSEIYKSNPKRLCDLLATKLRELHETDFSDCPIKDRIGEYLALARANYMADSYNKEYFPDSFGYSSGKEAFDVLEADGHLLKNEVLLHGDYCMPNVMLDGWKFSGFIDLDHSGVGDRHIDLFWGRWSLGFNLGTYEYSDRFFDAYGRDKIDEHLMHVVAAAEVLG